MTNFYEFASNNPWLTFGLFIVVTEMVVRVAWAIRGTVKTTDSGDQDDD